MRLLREAPQIGQGLIRRDRRLGPVGLHRRHGHGGVVQGGDGGLVARAQLAQALLGLLDQIESPGQGQRSSSGIRAGS
jgi:hypothetical protein